MIYFGLTSPMLFQPLVGEDDPTALCTQALQVLKDGVRNGVFLVDQRGVLDAATAGAIAEWPEKYRKKAEELLERMANRGRFVRVAMKDLPSAFEPACATAAALSESAGHDCLVVPSHCGCGGIGVLCRSDDALRLNEYNLGFPEHFEKSSLVFRRGDNERFEAEVLSRLFRTAKWVRVVDRMIGMNAGPRAEWAVPENYRRGLLWLADCVAKYSTGSRISEIIVVTGWPWERNTLERLSPRQQSYTRQVFDQFGKELESRCRASVHFKHTERRNLPHDRYLLTDQIAIAVGQGFDLLLPDGRLTSCSVSLLPDDELRRLTRDYWEVAGAP